MTKLKVKSWTDINLLLCTYLGGKRQTPLITSSDIATVYILKYGSEEKGSSLCKCSILLGFLMSKKQERLRSELLSEDKITNLLGFLT